MSIVAVRPMFRSIMKELGFKEWRSSLEPDNIPKTLTENVYHLRTDSVAGVKQNQNDLEMDVACTLTFAKKGMKEEVQALESGEITLQELIQETLKPANRLNTVGIKNIIFNQATPEPLATSNDNITLFRVGFTCLVVLGF